MKVHRDGQIVLNFEICCQYTDKTQIMIRWIEKHWKIEKYLDENVTEVGRQKRLSLSAMNLNDLNFHIF